MRQSLYDAEHWCLPLVLHGDLLHVACAALLARRGVSRLPATC